MTIGTGISHMVRAFAVSRRLVFWLFLCVLLVLGLVVGIRGLDRYAEREMLTFLASPSKQSAERLKLPGIFYKHILVRWLDHPRPGLSDAQRQALRIEALICLKEGYPFDMAVYRKVLPLIECGDSTVEFHAITYIAQAMGEREVLLFLGKWQQEEKPDVLIALTIALCKNPFLDDSPEFSGRGEGCGFKGTCEALIRCFKIRDVHAETELLEAIAEGPDQQMLGPCHYMLDQMGGEYAGRLRRALDARFGGDCGRLGHPLEADVIEADVKR